MSRNPPNLQAPRDLQRDFQRFSKWVEKSSRFTTPPTVDNRTENKSGTISSTSQRSNNETRLNHGFQPEPKTPPPRPPPPKIHPPTIIRPTSRQVSITQPHAIAKFPFIASVSDELSCAIGDTIMLKSEVNSDWLYGSNTRTGQTGIVPITFLEIKVPLTPSPPRVASIYPTLPAHRLNDASKPQSFHLTDNHAGSDWTNVSWNDNSIVTQTQPQNYPVSNADFAKPKPPPRNFPPRTTSIENKATALYD